MLGMTTDEYWCGDPNMVKFYVKAQELRREQKNQEMYMQGVYVYKAMQTALGEFGYGLGGCKGKKPDGYLEYPIPITEHEKEMETERNKAKTLAWVSEGQK